MSAQLDCAESVVKSRIWLNAVMTSSVPSSKVPSPGHPPNVPSLLSCQVTVCTGTVTIALADPPVQVSGVPFPTVMSTRVDASAPIMQLLPCGRLQVVDESLVSLISVTVKSDPPLESMRPTPQPVCVTD